MSRSDVFVKPVGSANTAGTRRSGADVKVAPEPNRQEKLEGLLEVSIDFHGTDAQKISDALNAVGAKSVRTQ